MIGSCLSAFPSSVRAQLGCCPFLCGWRELSCCWRSVGRLFHERSRFEFRGIARRWGKSTRLERIGRRVALSYLTVTTAMTRDTRPQQRCLSQKGGSRRFAIRTLMGAHVDRRCVKASIAGSAGVITLTACQVERVPQGTHGGEPRLKTAG